MAGIDYTIPGQFKGIQLELPMNAMAQAMQLRGLQESAQMNALKAQEYQQQIRERNALAQLMGDSTLEFGSEPFMRQVLAKAPSMYEGIATRVAQRENLLSQQEARRSQAEAREAETEKRKFEAEKLKGQLSKEQFQTAINELASYDTVNDVLSGVQQKLDAGIITPAQAQQVVAGLPQNDAEIPAWQIKTMRGLLTPKERLEDVRAETKAAREEKRLSFEETRVANEAARLELEDKRIQEQTRHANAMESIGRAGADRAALQAEETVRHNRAMERLDAARVNISAAAEARKDQQGGAQLSNKEIQKRESVLPQATAAIKGFEAKSESFVNDLKALRDHPGLSQITGLIAGRVPALTAEGRAAQALYDKILAKGGFEALQQMREASKTGGALGNVSNQEGKQLQASFAAIDRRQDAADVKKALDTAIGDVEGARTRMREAYNDTYSYREQPPAAPAPKLSPVDKQALDWANSNPKDPRAAQIKQRLGVK
jgi:hypothetical protein